MKKRYKIVFIITSLLILFSLIVSIVNYSEAIKLAKNRIKKQSLPLSLNSVYTSIQKHVVEPYIISSMMADNIFLKDWILGGEKDTKKIVKYLSTIKNRYKVFTTFLVCDSTKNYYMNKGFLETLSEKRKENQWYFRFKRSKNEGEINLDINNKLSDSLIMFINYKIFDKNHRMIGVTGVSHKLSYINRMMKAFKQKYKLDVYIFNREGRIILSQKDNKIIKNIKDISFINTHYDKIISKIPVTFQYKKKGEIYTFTTKYIPELDLYILAQAKLSDFTGHVIQTFYFSLVVSFIVTIFVAVLIISVIRKYNKQLEYLATKDSLTGLMNRRSFIDQITIFLNLSDRNKHPISILFVDLDDFKQINDTFNHQTGDEVLKRVSSLLMNSVRSTDLIARWGGEEFVISFLNTNIEKAFVVSEKIRKTIENDTILIKLSKTKLTVSLGLTEYKYGETLETLIARADNAMYIAKKKGKNRIEKIM